MATMEELRKLAEQEVYKAACRQRVEEGIVVKYEDAFDQATFDTAGSGGHDDQGNMTFSDITELHPLACDLVTFVMWLRDSTDFFSGPDYKTDGLYPKADDPNFSEVLADNALIYTGE